MSMLEKQALVNAITLRLAEDYSIKMSELQQKLTDIMVNYHITISDEAFCGKNLTTEYLFGKFADGKRAVGMSDKTLKQYKIAVESAEKYTGKILSEMEGEDINNWLKKYSREVSSVTVRAKYQLISSVFTFLSDRRYISFNPMRFTNPPKQTVVYKNPLASNDLEAVKRVCESLPNEKESLRDMALIHTFISTGCRVSEIANLKMKDVNLDSKTCIVLGKGNKERAVVLTDRACYRLKLYLETRKDTSDYAPLFASIKGNEKELSKDGIELIVRKLGRKAGVNKLTCHVFRRFYATELRRRNVPLQMIASSLGHANLNQINRYSLFDTSEMTSTIREAM